MLTDPHGCLGLVGCWSTNLLGLLLVHWSTARLLVCHSTGILVHWSAASLLLLLLGLLLLGLR